MCAADLCTDDGDVPITVFKNRVVDEIEALFEHYHLGSYGHNPPFHVAPRSIYVIVWDRSNSHRFHWGLLVAVTETTGIRIHYPHGFPENTRTTWLMSLDHWDPYSRPRLAMKVGHLDELDAAWVKLIQQVVDTTLLDEPTTNCNAWAMAALYDLAETGLLDMSPDRTIIRDIEQEALSFAIDAREKNRQYITESVQYIP